MNSSDLAGPVTQQPANASLFITTLKLVHHLLTFPSRALVRIRRLDTIALDLHEHTHASQRQSQGIPGYRRHRNVGGPNVPPFPGPWGFLTSGYFIGLFVMAFVLNRIQNIVVPPRRPLVFRIHNNHVDVHGRRPVSLRRALFGMLIPVDFSSTFSKALFRVPSIYFLGKAICVWVALLAISQDPTFFSRIARLQAVGDWVAQKSMQDICWYTFRSTCFALCIGTLTTGLEGLNINDSAPFNLFAFAFQLYVESASHLGMVDENESPSRPNTHIIITILLPLLQLIIMHTLEIKRSWSHHRLLLSSLGGVLALLHFHYVLYFSSVPYPLTTYAARVVESTMAAIIVLTVVLSATTQLLAEGTLARPLFGHAALLPRRDEDFNVALFRLGTACMEATAVAGLSNEVGAVASTPAAASARGRLEIDRTGVSGLSAAYEQRGRRRAAKAGFGNEIADVKVKRASTDFWMDTVLNVAWQRHLGTFLLSAWRATRRLWRLGVAGLRGQRRVRERSPSVVLLDGPPAAANEGDDTDPYGRFLRGESVSDDEENFQPEDEHTPSTVSENEDDKDEEEEYDDGEEQAKLYADLSNSPTTSAPLLLAHMTVVSPSPLTRRGYQRLMSARRHSNTDVDEWDNFVLERRQVKRDAAREADENPRTCVICTVEPRDIICWPCRCLALCDDCRNNLASRSSASKHTCPCCRRSVEGYSKIYIP